MKSRKHKATHKIAKRTFKVKLPTYTPTQLVAALANCINEFSRATNAATTTIAVWNFHHGVAYEEVHGGVSTIFDRINSFLNGGKYIKEAVLRLNAFRPVWQLSPWSRTPVTTAELDALSPAKRKALRKLNAPLSTWNGKTKNIFPAGYDPY